MANDKEKQTDRPAKSRDEQAHDVAKDYAEQQRRLIEKLRKRQDGHSGEH